jgi:hypothetical protein
MRRAHPNGLCLDESEADNGRVSTISEADAQLCSTWNFPFLRYLRDIR